MSIWKRLFGKNETPTTITTTTRERNDEPTVFDVKTGDAAMAWGIEKANLTLWYFKECLHSPKSNQQYFSIKAKIEDGSKAEHMWLNSPTFDAEGNLFGTVGNEPIDVRNVRLNEQIGVAPDMVSDWMILEDGRLIGGYTIRAIRDGLPDNELPQFDASLGGILVDEGEDHFPVDATTPEGAILSLEAAYDADDLEAALACKDFNLEAEQMMNTIGIPLNDGTAKEMAEVIRLTFIKSLQENGMPKFHGVKRSFPVRAEISVDHCLVTEVCIYPDGGKSAQRMHTAKVNGEWKVMAPEG